MALRKPLSATMTKQNNRDEEYIMKFIEALGLHTQYKSAYRFGKSDVSRDQSKRPIKVMMQSKEHKDRIMTNLKELTER